VVPEVPHEIVITLDEGHIFLQPNNRLNALWWRARCMSKYLGDAVGSVRPALTISRQGWGPT